MIWNTSNLSASHISRDISILLLIATQFALFGFLGWKWSSWPLHMIVSMIWNTSELYTLHLRRATAICFVGCCFYWLYMIVSMILNTSELSASNFSPAENGAKSLRQVGWRYNRAKLSLFWPYIIFLPHLIWYYKSYETLRNCLHYTSAVPQPFLLFIAADLALAGCLGWKWSLWPVPTWLEV